MAAKAGRVLARHAKPQPLPAAAFRPFGIVRVQGRDGACPVTESGDGAFRFGVLRRFRRSGGRDQRVLVVAPLAGAYPGLLRDLVLALLREIDEVAITDWPDSRYVPQS